MTDLRCDNSILFGVVDGNILEVKCRSARCGAGKGVVVIHRFSLPGGELIATKQYKNPPNPKGSPNELSPGHGSAVRLA